MRGSAVTARLTATVLAAVVLAGCEGGPASPPSPSPAATVTASEATSPLAAAGDLDELIVACDDQVAIPAELAVNAARRSMGVADPHGEDEDGEATPGSTNEAARREAQSAARAAADAVAACLQRTTELSAAASPTPDRRMALVQSRLRDVARAIGLLERALQQGEAVHEPARLVTDALAEWRRLAAPLRG